MTLDSNKTNANSTAILNGVAVVAHDDKISSTTTQQQQRVGDLILSDTLVGVFPFLDIQDISSIVRVSKTWKIAFEMIEESVWETLMTKYYPHLANIIRMGPTHIVDGKNHQQQENKKRKIESRTNNTSTTNQDDIVAVADPKFTWKESLKIKIGSSSSYKPVGLNRTLQKDLEVVFRPRGIVAFSNCCQYYCSGAYNEDSSFQTRSTGGIYFIRLHLNGMNYDPERTFVAASYYSWEYLMKNWETEYQLLVQWCAVLGLTNPGDYIIEKPESIEHCVTIHFKKYFKLEAEVVEDDGDGVRETYI